jgi:gliding motility-associated-like protein
VNSKKGKLDFMKHLLLLITLVLTGFSTLFSQPPTSNFTVSDDVICAGECITVTNNSSSNSLTYAWTFPGGTPAVYNGQNPGPICFNTEGTYTVSLTVTNASGSNISNWTITVGEIPTLTVTLSDTVTTANVLGYEEISDTTIYMFEEAYLFAEGTPAGGTLIWYPSGVEGDSIVGCSACVGGDSLIVNPFYTTNYQVTYTTANGCSASGNVIVNVLFSNYFKIALPNSFSPNEDGENDRFRILTNVDKDNDFENGFEEGGSIVDVDFRIYDKYGKMVFRTIDPTEGWDGTYKGKPLNPSTYTYYVSYRRIDGRSGELKGNVTLFR